MQMDVIDRALRAEEERKRALGRARVLETLRELHKTRPEGELLTQAIALKAYLEQRKNNRNVEP
jgi:hypothetical protein